MTLNEVGFDTVALHAMITQRQRLASLAKFKSHFSNILIATDVASRGLDIPAVSLVINHIIPNNATDYVHRVGRTARAGKQGRAISIVTQHDVKLVQAIEKKINIRLKEYDVSGMLYICFSNTYSKSISFDLDVLDFYNCKYLF